MRSLWESGGRSGPRRRAQAAGLQTKALCPRLRPSPGDAAARRKVRVVIPQLHQHRKSEVVEAAPCRDLFTPVQQMSPERVGAAVCPGDRGGRCPWRGGGAAGCSEAGTWHYRGSKHWGQEAGARSLDPEDRYGKGRVPCSRGSLHSTTSDGIPDVRRGPSACSGSLGVTAWAEKDTQTLRRPHSPPLPLPHPPRGLLLWGNPTGVQGRAGYGVNTSLSRTLWTTLIQERKP